jgi:hypothetical protein
MVWGLRTLWVGATGTQQLALHASSSSLIAGFVGGVCAALICVWLTLRSLSRTSTRRLLAGSLDADNSQRAKRRSAHMTIIFAFVFAALGALMLALAATKRVGETIGFFGAGVALLVALLCFESAWLRSGRRRKLIHGRGWPALARLGWRNAAHRPARSVLCVALVASATFIVVAVDAFRERGAVEVSDRKSGAGGYPLMAESLLPVVHDPETTEGREALNLNVTADDSVLASVRFARFRVRAGDDASCLNLYQPREPRILSVAPAFVREGRFTFQSSLAGNDQERANPWLLLERDQSDGVLPVVADANSLEYVLHKKLGEEIDVRGDDGEQLRLRVVAALSDSLFQSELLMSERNFLRAFPHRQGYRFFLIDAPTERAQAAAARLEEQLSDYGFDTTPTAERLASYHRVENTYISTFQALGGLGTLLGTLGLAAVLLRNVLERRRELALLRAVGYSRANFAVMIVAENALLLVSGLLIGALCAALAVVPALLSRVGGPTSPRLTLAALLLAILAAGFLASLAATAAALRAPLLRSLRAE